MNKDKVVNKNRAEVRRGRDDGGGMELRVGESGPDDVLKTENRN